MNVLSCQYKFYGYEVSRMHVYCGEEPRCDRGVFIAEGAFVIGRVEIGRDSSVFYNAVVRGDVNSITIGAETNIQDNCTLHVTVRNPLRIGNMVTIGHNAVIHGCTIGNNVLIGIGAIVLDGAVIGDNSIVAAGSLVAPGKQYSPQSMIMGTPAKRIRSVTDAEIERIRETSRGYLRTKEGHRTGLRKRGPVHW